MSFWEPLPVHLHIWDFLPCESFVPLHALAGNVCISKRRFLPWVAARAFMSFLIQDFTIYLCASYTSQWLFWSSLGSIALITKPGTEIFP